jgi:hypothetical protein
MGCITWVEASMLPACYAVVICWTVVACMRASTCYVMTLMAAIVEIDGCTNKCISHRRCLRGVQVPGSQANFQLAVAHCC